MRLLHLLAFTAVFFASAIATAIPVSVTTNEYRSWWYWAPTGGQYQRVAGDATIDVPEGTFEIRLDWVAGVTCHVDANGNVTVVSPSDAAMTGGANSLEFEPIPVSLDVSGYAFDYIAPGINRANGDNTLWVVPGVGGHYAIGLDHANPGSGLRFEVDAAGVVTPRNDTSGDHAESLVGGVGTLAFKTVPVTIDPVAHDGRMRFRYGPTWQGAQQFTLVRGAAISVAIGHDWVAFEVDANGDVTSRNPVAATGGIQSLTMNNVDVTIDPGVYDSVYNFYGSGSGYWVGGGVKQHTIVPGVRWGIRLPSGNSTYFFEPDANGDITVETPETFEAVGSTLRFRTVPVTIDPGLFQHGWGPFFQSSDYPLPQQRLTGEGTYNLPQGTGWSFLIGGASGVLRINIDATGNVDTVSPPVADVVGNTVNLRTVKIGIDPGAYTDQWAFLRYPSWIDRLWYGPQTFDVVPGFDYSLGSLGGGGRQFFSLYEPCAVSPEVVQTNTASFAITCDVAPPDGDGDGVPDDADNCPDVANAAQVDVDSDGIGDVCDDDLDGDGVSNASDNCPEFSNTSQVDTDGDGLGDVCDADRDGDSVADDSDNCPDAYNADQADNDGDGFGDVCDGDDDDDGVADGSDNCPFVANAAQVDVDGDGIGDVCDADTDGDGVANEDDQCPESPGSQPVDVNGCNGAQYIDLTCNPDAFANHGRYVSCVAQAGTAAVEAGLISRQERSRFVREAAKQR